jgi:hypothetical protein
VWGDPSDQSTGAAGPSVAKNRTSPRGRLSYGPASVTPWGSRMGFMPTRLSDFRARTIFPSRTESPSRRCDPRDGGYRAGGCRLCSARSLRRGGFAGSLRCSGRLPRHRARPIRSVGRGHPHQYRRCDPRRGGMVPGEWSRLPLVTPRGGRRPSVASEEHVAVHFDTRAPGRRPGFRLPTRAERPEGSGRPSSGAADIDTVRCPRREGFRGLRHPLVGALVSGVGSAVLSRWRSSEARA